ncbi:MAG: helix-turn-helix domain-containing protein, partial [Bacteriovoracaceae bacterium]
EVQIDATPAQIEQAYLRARNAYTGDSVALYSIMSKEDCNALLQQIEEAYSILGFPEKRREYDRIRGFNQPVQPSGKGPAQKNLQYEDFGSIHGEAKVSKISAIKKFGLEYETNPEMEEKIRDCSIYTGPFLKEIREYKNVSVERMAEMTRISKTHIKAIEAEDTERLPADVYVRGYVYQYAKVLKLNPEVVAASFLLYYKQLKSGK